MGAGGLLYILAVVAVFWFLLIRPSQQQAKKRASMLEQLKPGVKVITIGGICGVVKALTENRVFLEIADGLTIEMLRTSISQVVTDDDLEEDEEDDDEYDEEYDEYEVEDENDKEERR